MPRTSGNNQTPVIKGRLLDMQGEPMGNTQVFVQLVTELNIHNAETTRTDDQGRFAVALEALKENIGGKLKIGFSENENTLTTRLASIEYEKGDNREPISVYQLIATIDEPADVVQPEREKIPTVAITSHDFMSTSHERVWQSIQDATLELSFSHYLQYVDKSLEQNSCNDGVDEFSDIKKNSQLFNSYGVNSYELLDSITEQFMYDKVYSQPGIHQAAYLQEIAKNKLPDWHHGDDAAYECQPSRLQMGQQILKPLNFCPIELIWSYWVEESLLMQAFNRIALRFQNRSATKGGPDPLAHLEIDPLRPLNNLIWGFIQNEGKRLSLVRRAYEYDHHYGIQLQGSAVPTLRPADSRSGFLKEFHALLHTASDFHRQTDDVTVRADPFPVMNAIYDVHIKLAEGAHNQFGDLPTVARKEMLMMQWVMARPEMREFLNGRLMVPQSEGWMDRVEHMKRIQGWPNLSMQHFVNLANYGEQLMVSIRNMDWANLKKSEFAGSWATFWREPIQGYMHSYRAITGIDILGNDPRIGDNPSAAIYGARKESA